MNFILVWRNHVAQRPNWGCKINKFCHLYRIHRPANLIGRLGEVDPGASHVFDLSQFILTFHMKGPLSYIGGKNRIASQIIATFPKHTTYVEAFAGGAQVLFHKEPSPVEIINDLDGDVVNFFRICQAHFEELIRSLRYTLVSRRWFSLLEAQNVTTLTDIQRACRFLYLQKTSYAGLVRRRNYNYSVVGPPSLNPARLPELIEETHRRLQRVQIECLPYEEILKRFGRPATLFYLDPPYFGRKLYNFNFSEADFVELAKRLGELQSKFVLSLNDVPEVRRIFHRFYFREIELAYTAQQTAGKRFRELLITNYRLGQPHPEVKL